eukprot:CAMPEP_0170564946 /NCGR_PEP_ID=MMETSP0211-20121228/75798_1 /TAXON_ID=311385 /ORGANISM="Pseudokeronopsis sp., Strain OXSARD2" /LENGTH=78 /DNA_ID=CAMNT_0010885089 /DNA_START=93 /DNA_END=329 /DNA_ORIENTATION=+
MRENIDLFKDNVNLLKKKNEDLEEKIGSSNSEIIKYQELEQLFNGLKEDNESLARELQNVEEENTHLQVYLEKSKGTI